MNFIYVEKIERDAGAYDIGDGIDRPHFVKMNFFDRNPVNLRLGLAQNVETRPRRSVLPDLESMRGRSVPESREDAGDRVPIPGFHVKFRRCNSPPRGFFDPVTGPEVQAFQGLEDGVRGDSRVDQGADGHVAADA